MNPSDLATGFKDFTQLQIALKWQPSDLVPLIRYMEYPARHSAPSCSGDIDI